MTSFSVFSLSDVSMVPYLFIESESFHKSG